MKKFLLSLGLMTIVFSGIQAQISPDFTATDCNGNSHHLYAELNAGKVIVLVWVMPCPACVFPSLDANFVVQGYQASNPNTVYMYLCDDIANTPCDTLDAWQLNIGLVDVIQFSDTTINMSNYGLPGMPKIVAIGGSNHTVFYNSNYTVSDTALQNAIDAALLATGLDEPNSTVSAFTVFPNPAGSQAEIKFNLVKASEVKIELFDLQSNWLQTVFSGKGAAGENKAELKTSPYAAGMYLVKFTEAGKSRFMNVVISH